MSFLIFEGQTVPPLPDTAETIRAELQKLLSKIYTGGCGDYTVTIRADQSVRLEDASTWVQISFLPKTSLDRGYHPPSLRVEGGNKTFNTPIAGYGKTHSYTLVGEFDGYLRSCQKAVSFFLESKVADVWIEDV